MMLEMGGMLATIILLVVFALLLIFLGIQIVPDGNGRIVERLGRRHRVLMPGVNIIIPVLDRIKKRGFDQLSVMVKGGEESSRKLWTPKGDISLAEQRMDPKEDRYLAKDNSEIWVDTVAYFRLIDPMKIAYDVAAFESNFVSIIETNLRQ